MSKKTFLALSLLTKNKPGVVTALAKLTKDCGCNIHDSHMSQLGSEFAIMALLSGSWDAIAKLETQLPNFKRRNQLQIIARRTDAAPAQKNHLPYSVEVIGMDNPGLVHEVSQFFTEQDISISELYTNTYSASHTGSPMFSLVMTVTIPANIPITTLREKFILFCDDLNLDANIELAKE